MPFRPARPRASPGASFDTIFAGCPARDWVALANRVFEARYKEMMKARDVYVDRYPKRAGMSVSEFDDFSDEFKEAEIIEVCRTADLITKNQAEILRERS